MLVYLKTSAPGGARAPVRHGLKQSQSVDSRPPAILLAALRTLGDAPARSLTALAQRLGVAEAAAPTALPARPAQRGSWGWTRAAVSVPGRKGEASGEAPLHMLTGCQLTAYQHGPGGTEPARRAAAWPLSLPTQQVTVIVVDGRAWYVLCNTSSAAPARVEHATVG